MFAEETRPSCNDCGSTLVDYRTIWKCMNCGATQEKTAEVDIDEEDTRELERVRRNPQFIDWE